MSLPEVNVSAEDGTVFLKPTGHFDEIAARLIDELVSSTAGACARVVVDLRSLAPGRHAGLRLLPVIERRATVIRGMEQLER